MDIKLVAAELQIRKNANIPCADFYNFILSQQDLLKKIISNEKFDKRVNPWGFYHFWEKKIFFDFAVLVRRIIVENGLGYQLTIFV
jgi:hypothetical protein